MGVCCAPMYECTYACACMCVMIIIAPRLCCCCRRLAWCACALMDACVYMGVEWTKPTHLHAHTTLHGPTPIHLSAIICMHKWLRQCLDTLPEVPAKRALAELEAPEQCACVHVCREIDQQGCQRVGRPIAHPLFVCTYPHSDIVEHTPSPHPNTPTHPPPSRARTTRHPPPPQTRRGRRPTPQASHG